jgi:hypothetical protein
VEPFEQGKLSPKKHQAMSRHPQHAKAIEILKSQLFVLGADFHLIIENVLYLFDFLRAALTNASWRSACRFLFLF